MASEAAAMPSIASPACEPVSQKAEASKPRPCCVCTEEKSKRDECMLFSKAADPAKDCRTTIELYKSCMAGFGFKV